MEVKRLTVRLSAVSHRLFKIYAAEQAKDMTAILQEYIAELISESETAKEKKQE